MSAPVHGVLVVDKPAGRTSHDVVARARRALGTRAVGHAGTLDPMATGVLVLAVGEGTKLVQYLTAKDKEYDATLRLGVSTDSLDADGEVTETRELPEGLSADDLRVAARSYLGEHDQRAPVVSAIKVKGRALHRRVRAGEKVEAPVRRVVLHAIDVRRFDPPDVELHVRCGKGFYVRALARDLAEAVGTVGHLVRLRRTRSGSSTLADAVAWETLEAAAGGDAAAAETLLRAVVGLRPAWGAAPALELSDAGFEHARHGRPVPLDEAAAGAGDLDPDTTVALLHGGRLVALARLEGDRLRIARGIREDC